MKGPPSIAHRLLISLAALLGIVWIAGTGLSLWIAGRALDGAFDSAQLETARRILPLAVEEILNRDAGESAEGPERVASLLSAEDRYTYIVRDAKGTVLLRSADANVGDFPTVVTLGFSENDRHRIYAEGAIQGSFVVQVADPLARRGAALLSTAVGLLLPLPVVLAVGAFGIWHLVKSGLRPAASLRRQVEQRHGDALDPIDTDDLPAEIAPLAAELNRLMGRVQRTIEAERDFTANSAHELRTPIAGALAQTQRLILEAPEGPLRERARKIEAGLRALASLAAKLVDLSRAEAGLPVPAEPVDLQQVLDIVLHDAARDYAASARLRVERRGSPLRARVDPEAFAILIRNLVENALRHGDPASEVAVTIGANSVQIINLGPPIPAEVLERLRKRFSRGNESRGSGLGLSIAEAVARSIGADLILKSPATGRDDGFESMVRFEAI